jgi:alkylation response protein AidB-like acyl-CoA dehydrogenase
MTAERTGGDEAMQFGVDVKNSRGTLMDSPRDQDILDKTRHILPLIAAEATQSESLGRLSDPTFQALSNAELFWMWLPQELGGSAVRATTALKVYEEVAAADGSAGWVLMAISLNTAVATAYCGGSAVDALFADRSNPPKLVGMAAPRGEATVVNGGFLASGNYQFGSGAAYANWFIGGVTIKENGKLQYHADGSPVTRVCIVPRNSVIVTDEWNCMGMEGTGSVDYKLPEQFVPDGFAYLLPNGVLQRGLPIFNFPMSIGCLGHIGISLGLMKRALAEISHIAQTKKRPGYPSVIADDSVFKNQFATAEANYQAIRSLTFDLYFTAESAVAEGIPLSKELQSRCLQALSWAYLLGSEVMRFCHLWGCAEAVLEPSALGRAFRNMYVATNHQLNDQLNLVNAAPVLLETWQATHRSLYSSPPLS